jgi:hypothetical protein
MQRWILGLAVIGTACGHDDGKTPMDSDTGRSMVAGSAKIVHGPSGAPGARARIGVPPIPADGRWSVTPDKAKLTFLSITFTTTDGQPIVVPLTDCEPEYDRDASSISQLLDCPFQVPAGQYSALSLGVSTTYQMLLDDATNGFFTNGSGIVTTSPGTATYSSFTVPGPGGVGTELSAAIFLSKPLDIVEGSPVSLQILVDMIHMIGIDVSAGTATVDLSLPTLPAMIVPSASGAGKTAFYSFQSSTDNLKYGPLGSTQTWSGVRVFYAEPPQPSFIFHPVPGPSEAYNVNPAKAPPNGTMFKAGGYLGVDSSMTMCWAMPANDFSYTTYDRVCRLPVGSLGNASTLECQTGPTAPAPTAGDTYASGCPTITSNVTATLTLVAE